MRTTETRELSAFGRLVQNRSRNLSLLKLIETTLARLDEQLMEVQLANDAADRFIARIKEHGITIDDGTDLVAIFEDARDQMSEFYRVTNECHISVAADADLSDEDGIVEAFARLADEAAELHNKLNTLAWLIGESIADGETPIEQEFTSADALFAALR
ncbi:hypothetical protein GTP45_00885 [Pseudoduganella sp. FT55W]|uniref:Uncharacterized protein n=1 Tax=Duganella rivi TaxID=2666083 RepID=A0A7X4GMR2_9BURK|nr:hypothetical protein [Duganella rivi]MYM65387.1 hypothetical protein [Duganella rivi]